MQNHINIVNSIKKDIALHLPNGMDEQFLKKIPYLLKRINELELALVPFAKKHAQGGHPTTTASDVNVSRFDCEFAWQMLDPKNSVQMERKVEYPYR